MTKILKIQMYDEKHGTHYSVRPFTDKELEETGQTPEMILNKMFNKLKNLLLQSDNKDPSTKRSLEEQMHYQALLEWINENHVKPNPKEGRHIGFIELVKKQESARKKVVGIILDMLYSNELPQRVSNIA